MAVSGETPAVVLKVTDHGESDKIVTFYCPVLGKQTGIAKGAKRSKKRFVNKLEIFSLLDLQYAPSNRSSLFRIDQAEILHSFPFLRRNYQAYAAAVLLCELILNWTRENDGDSELFGLLVWALDKLDRQQPVSEILILFQIRMFGLLGYRPQLAGCLECGGMDGAGTPYRFSAGRSGLICAKCNSRPPLTGTRLPPLSLNTVKLLLKAQDLPRQKLLRLRFSPAATGESLAMLRQYGSYLLQREIHSWKAVSEAVAAGWQAQSDKAIGKITSRI
jgi:DNA repair protein RecO (recombination protein O)